MRVEIITADERRRALEEAFRQSPKRLRLTEGQRRYILTRKKR